MKYLIVSIVLIVLLSCKEGISKKKAAKGSESTELSKLDSINNSFLNEPAENKASLQEAKDIAKKIFYYVEQVDMKKMSKKQLKKVADPLQKRLDSFRSVLSVQQIEELDEYRTMLVSEMVDRKVIRDRQ